MNIKEFLETYNTCPFCASILPLTAEVTSKSNLSDEKCLRAKVYHNNDVLNIKVSSNYFVVANAIDIDFSISIIDGNIAYCGMTSLFISLYDINIKIKKRCNQHDHSFSRVISLFYDRSESVFDIRPILDTFSFRNEYDNYTVKNDYVQHSTSLFISNHIPIRSHFIPLDKFPLHNIHKLTTKLTAIALLI